MDHAARYFLAQLSTFGTIELALEAFNTDQQYGGVPPFLRTRSDIIRINQLSGGLLTLRIIAASTKAKSRTKAEVAAVLVAFGIVMFSLVKAQGFSPIQSLQNVTEFKQLFRLMDEAYFDAPLDNWRVTLPKMNCVIIMMIQLPSQLKSPVWVKRL